MRQVAILLRKVAVVIALTVTPVLATSAATPAGDFTRIAWTLAAYDALVFKCTGERDNRLRAGLIDYAETFENRTLRRWVGGGRITSVDDMREYYEHHFERLLISLEQTPGNQPDPGGKEDTCSEENLRSAYNAAGSMALAIEHPVFMAELSADEEVVRPASEDQAAMNAPPTDAVKDPAFKDLLLLELASGPDFYEEHARVAAFGIESGLYGANSDACRELTMELRTGVRQPVPEELLAIGDRGEERLAELLSLVRSEAPRPVQLIIAGNATLGDYDLASRGMALRAPVRGSSVLGTNERQRVYAIMAASERYLSENSRLTEDGPCEALVTSFLQALVMSDTRDGREPDWDQQMLWLQPQFLNIQVAAVEGLDKLPMSPERASTLQQAGVQSVRIISAVRVDMRQGTGPAEAGRLPGTVMSVRILHPETDELMHEFVNSDL